MRTRFAVSDYVIEHCHEENDFVLPLLCPFFKQKTDKIGQLLFVTFNINRFTKF